MIMEPVLFPEQQAIEAHAIFVGERLELRRLEATRRIARSPLVVQAGEHGVAVLLRYGVVVLFNVAPVEEVNFLDSIRQFIVRPLAEHRKEYIPVRIDPALNEGVDSGEIVLQVYSVERIQLIAGVLAKSVVLDHYETGIAHSFDQIEPLAEQLHHKGKTGRKAADLIRHIGDILMIYGKMVGRVEVAEKPELLWEHPELEGLYLRLEDEYELRERHHALERKLDLISRTATTMLDLLQHNQGIRVEWYIVILIVVDIIISLWEKLI